VLDACAEGDEKTGAKVVEQAERATAAAARDVYEQVEEDAASVHDPEKLSQSASKRNSD
jgi:hypothetical protein